MYIDAVASGPWQALERSGVAGDVHWFGRRFFSGFDLGDQLMTHRLGHRMEAILGGELRLGLFCVTADGFLSKPKELGDAPYAMAVRSEPKHR
jgi:hypothetical protein